MTVLREVAVCKGCDWTWRPLTGRISENCPKCGRTKDVRVRKSAPRNLEGLKRWRANHPGYATIATRKARRSALLVVGDGIIRCVRCGCDMEQLLEINHKNGGGARELRGRSQQFYRDIAMRKRDASDLELMCKPCNGIHALELLHGALPMRVVWGANP
jgi:predicted RNA-binding Zn-ribbon protein involved in translation (DUF1610 family)